MKIAVGETVDGKRTMFLNVFTADGLLSTGGADGNYEGPALSAPTILYQHNLDGWAAKLGTFTAGGNGGEASYVFDDAETDPDLSRGMLMLRVIDAGFRTQTMLIAYGLGIQPGDTDPDARRIYFFVVTDDAGLIVAGVPDQTFTADATTDVCTAAAHTYRTTDGPVRVSNSGGALPTGLAALTDYWIIRTGVNTFKLATSIANALAGTAVNITANGTGTQTIKTRPLVGESDTDASLYQAPGSSTTAFLAGVTLEYEHNTDGKVAAGGTITHVSGDLWCYDPTDDETAADLERGTIAVIATCTGFRTVVARVPFGETGGGDVDEPTITVISPTPGVAPGDAGGFPSDLSAARDTPIVLDVGDLAPGLVYFAIIARFYINAESEHPVEEVVYRRGQFRGQYVEGSSTVARVEINGLRMTIKRADGWPIDVTTKGKPFVVFAVDAVDGAGNLAS